MRSSSLLVTGLTANPEWTLFVLDPASQLDHAVADRANVDGSLGENRIVSERFEHTILESGVVCLRLELVEVRQVASETEAVEPDTDQQVTSSG